MWFLLFYFGWICFPYHVLFLPCFFQRRPVGGGNSSFGVVACPDHPEEAQAFSQAFKGNQSEI